MSNTYFQFKQFVVHHDRCAMKVTTDGCLFGAWCSKEMQKSKQKNSVLDIGTGTGLLALMIAQKNEVSLDAIEIDKEAAEQAKENIISSPWREQINVVHADVLHWKTDKRYDYIIANPPFYESELKSQRTTKNIAHHDEGLRLDNLFFLIRNFLTDDGSFFILLPAKRESELEILLRHHKLHLHQKVAVKQSENHNPFRLMIEGKKQSIDSASNLDIAIKSKSNEYTPAFIALLKDYYLYL